MALDFSWLYIPAAILVALFVWLMVAVIFDAKKRQNELRRNLDVQQEFLELSRHSVEMQEKSLELAENMLATQKEILRLLLEHRDNPHRESITEL